MQKFRPTIPSRKMITKTKTGEKCPLQEAQALAIKVLRLKESPSEGKGANNGTNIISQEKHSASIKVVRLQENILLEHIDLLEGSSEKDGYESDGLEDVDLSDGSCTQQFLLLPQCPITIHVDLLTSSESWNLAYKYAPELCPGEGINVQVQHTIRKLDSHILVCEVKYENDTEERMTLRKFFKVQALESLQPISNGTYFNLLNNHVRGNPEKFMSRMERGDNIILEGIKKLYLQISSLFCNMVSCFNVNHSQ